MGTPPPIPDASLDTTPDVIPTGDTDGDGLCDTTELARGTDPSSLDSDSDGFTDYAEVVFGFNPTVPSSPDRSTVFVLQESPSGALQVPIEQAVRGGGEDYQGSFEATLVNDRGDQSAETFYLESVPTFSVPIENVALVDEDSEAFRGVIGRTLLGFEVRFAYGEAITRSCIRAYPFRYNIKRSDGRLLAVNRSLLLILPPGETLATGEWCVPDGGCI